MSKIQRLLKSILLLLLVAFSFVQVHAGLPSIVNTPPKLLDPEQAFQLKVSSTPKKMVQFKFLIAKGYYLYRNRIQIEPQGFSLPTPLFPKGESKQDDHFGHVEIFRDQLSLSIQLPEKVPSNAYVVVRSQGCADIGVCYPPSIQKIAVSALLDGKTQASATNLLEKFTRTP